MLTMFLWFVAFAIGAISFSITKEKLSVLGRCFFSLMVILSVWVTSTYIAWLAGFEVSIGTVKAGLMAENWWLPLATIIWTIFSYFAFRTDSTDDQSI